MRAYALCIVTGIIVAAIITDRRVRRRGYPPGAAVDVTVWAVPAGIIGARLYHLATDPELYFTAGHNPWAAFAIWNGGLGIWGAVAGGAIGAWIGCRKTGLPLSVMADALAPALPVAQALGRFGNYFNQELFGRPTTLPWGLLIDPAHRPDGYARYATFHPTFLYEVLWDLGVAALVWALDRRYRFRHGRAFALYVMAYVVGRFWIEDLRIDTANHLLGLRLNDWTCLIVFIGAAAYLWRTRSSTRPASVGPQPAGTMAAGDTTTNGHQRADIDSVDEAAHTREHPST